MQPWIRISLVAAAVSLVATVAAHVYDCRVGTHEACLMSQGLLWVYWIGFLVVVGVPAATIVEAIRNSRRRKQRDDA
jgi:hypothetical protein